jgi:hypothetical protein
MLGPALVNYKWFYISYLFLFTAFSTTAFLTHSDHLPLLYTVFYAISHAHRNSKRLKSLYCFATKHSEYSGTDCNQRFCMPDVICGNKATIISVAVYNLDPHPGLFGVHLHNSPDLASQGRSQAVPQIEFDADYCTRGKGVFCLYKKTV